VLIGFAARLGGKRSGYLQSPTRVIFQIPRYTFCIATRFEWDAECITRTTDEGETARISVTQMLVEVSKLSAKYFDPNRTTTGT